MSDPQAVAIDPLAGDAIQPLSNVQSLQLDGRAGSRRQLQLHPAEPKKILRIFVAVTPDMKEHLLLHQPWLVEGDDPVAVRPPTRVVDCLQLHQRYSAPRLLIDDRDFEILLRGRRRAPQRRQEEKNAQEANPHVSSAVHRLIREARYSRIADSISAGSWNWASSGNRGGISDALITPMMKHVR